VVKKVFEGLVASKGSSGISTTANQITLCHNPEGHSLNVHRLFKLLFNAVTATLLLFLNVLRCVPLK